MSNKQKVDVEATIDAVERSLNWVIAYTFMTYAFLVWIIIFTLSKNQRATLISVGGLLLCNFMTKHHMSQAESSMSFDNWIRK